MGEASVWRSVVPDETRVPRRAPLSVVETSYRDEELAEEDSLVARVASREEEMWLVSSDSKFYSRWSLHGASPFKKAKQGVVLIPPHPSRGNMDSPLVLAIADALFEAGIVALRFDYRGVGRSRGTFDDVSAVRDLVAAAQALCATCETTSFVAIGYGSASALGNLYTKGCNRFVSISHGFGQGTTHPDGTERRSLVHQKNDSSSKSLSKLYDRTNVFFTTMRITIPKLWIVAEDDDLTPVDELKEWISHYSPGKGELSTIHIVKSATHMFERKERHVAALVTSWLTNPKVEPITFSFDFKSGKVDHVFE